MRRPIGRQSEGRHLQRMIRQFSMKDYRDSEKDYADTWQLVDEILYCLCRQHPRHNSRRSVYAKVAAIGRTYSTGIERKVPTRGTPGSSLAQVVDFFLAHDAEIDQWIVHLKKISEPLTTLGIRKILLIHGLLVNLLLSLTRDKQSVRSFVCKYLHFHNSAVPIYDNIAAGRLRGLVLLRPIKGFQVRRVRHADPEYADYVRRFTHLYRFATSQGLQVTVRSLDWYLTFTV